MKIAINFILFQAGWFVTVIGVAHQSEWVAIACVCTILFTHLYLVTEKYTELFLIIVSGLMGFIIDSFLISQGLFVAAGNIGLTGLAPIWLIALWMLFATTVNHSLRWLQRRYMFAAILGFVFAPLAYFAGHKAGVLTISADYSLYQVLLVIGAVWAIVTPLLLLISHASSSNQPVMSS
jgi:hypothetical protein